MYEQKNYGEQDATYQAAGGAVGIKQIVDRFYDIMQSDPRYQTIWSWHPSNAQTTRDKLSCFLSGWMGGPAEYAKTYGQISIPLAHAHLNVTEDEQQQWLGCMRQALESLDYPADFIQYLMEQLTIPATRIRQACQQKHQ